MFQQKLLSFSVTASTKRWKIINNKKKMLIVINNNNRMKQSVRIEEIILDKHVVFVDSKSVVLSEYE